MLPCLSLPAMRVEVPPYISVPFRHLLGRSISRLRLQVFVSIAHHNAQGQKWSL